MYKLFIDTIIQTEDKLDDSKKFMENQELHWRPLDDVMKSIEEDFPSNSENNEQLHNNSFLHNKKSKKNKRDKREKNVYLFDDLHKEMKSYWTPFGFLNKSHLQSFASSILPCIKISKYTDNVALYDKDECND